MFTPFFSVLKRRCMLPFLALLLLSGCGQPSSAHHAQKTPVAMHSGSTTPIHGPAPLGTSVAFDLGGWIHVQSTSGFTCSFSPLPLTPGTLVLPTVQPTYDQGTLQSVENYVTTLYDISRSGHLNAAPYSAFSANPHAFQLVAASTTALGGGECNEALQITNIGNTPVQISQISLQLTADTQTNHQRYNLIDACPLLSLGPNCAFGKGGSEDVEELAFHLYSGRANTIIPATCCGDQAVTLQSGEAAEVILFYMASDNLSFSLRPSFTLDWPGKQRTYPAPQLQERFAFASPSQFSCYALQGQQFIEVPLDVTTAHWCI